MNDPIDGIGFDELIDGNELREELISIGKHPDLRDIDRRRSVLGLLKETQAKTRAIIKRAFENGALPGVTAARALSHIQDVLIQALYDYTTSFPYRAAIKTESERLSVVAVGGYGRGMLAPSSDVDLLFVLPYKQTPWGESVTEYMLYILWDMGLKVGHATRTIDDCIRLSLQDHTIRTTLLESRLVWGDEALYADLKDRFDKEVLQVADGAEFIEAKLEERNRRHQRTGGARYMVEPSLKDGKGGLRDLHTLYWIGKHVHRVAHSSDLLEKKIFNKSEYRSFVEAEDFFWDVRCHLHFLTGRGEEKLSFDRQPDLAERMGFTDRHGRAAAGVFMTHYFRRAKDVGDLTRIFCAALELQQKKKSPGIGRWLSNLSIRPRRGNETSFMVENGRLNFANLADIDKDPVSMMRFFKASDDRDLLMHPEALTEISRALRKVDLILRGNEEANELFLEILCAGNDPERVLRRMSECGFLGRFIPDFGKVEAMMQFNMYHHFTVDEHTIQAIGTLARIHKGELEDDHPLASEIIGKMESHRVLYMALFLHDIAKGRKGDHSEEGAAIAYELCPRMGFSKSETETVAWLVLNHLIMSDTAQKRDLSDPKTIEDFAAVVQSPERLKLLLVLTVADIRAVGPGVWNGWKGELLRQLYYETERVLSGGHTVETRKGQIAAAKDKLAVALKDWPYEALAGLLDCHDDPYWLGVDGTTQVEHARLMMRAQEEDPEGERVFIDWRPDDFRDVTKVSIFTRDRVGVFAKMAGAITALGGSIADAKIFTTRKGMALDVFFVQDLEGHAFSDSRRLGDLAKRIERSLKEEGLPDIKPPRSLGHKRMQAFTIEPQVFIDNGASEIATVIEVNGLDRPGFLYDVVRTLSGLKLSISSAHVATFGERAVGVYYVKDLYGLKITHETRIRQIREALLEAIEG